MQIKRGDTFWLPLQVFVDDAAQDCTNWRVEGAYGSDTATLGRFLTVWQDRSKGEYYLQADTSDWPLGTMYLDITYITDAGQEVTTDRVPFQVLKRLSAIPLPPEQVVVIPPPNSPGG